MRTRATILAGALLTGVLWAAAPTSPAGAAVIVTSSGTTVNATVTDTTSVVTLQCIGGDVGVLNTKATPLLDCTALTTATITGDETNGIFGATPVASFPALTQVTISAGSGADTITGSTTREVIVGSTGNDRVTLPSSGLDDLVGLGGDAGDTLTVKGTAGADGITVSTGSPTSRTVVTRQTWDVVATSTANVEAEGLEGGDVLDATGITASSLVTRVNLRGGPGNDLLFCGVKPCSLVGDTGTNTLRGGAAADALFTTSPTDTVRGNAGTDGIADSGDGRVGRTIDTGGTGATPDNYQVSVRGDTHIRTRDLPSNGGRVTVTLGRSGRQDVDAGVGRLIYDTALGSVPVDRVLLELEALLGQAQSIQGDAGTVADIVVPSGGWSITTTTIFFTGGYEPITVEPETVYQVRAPFTDPEQRYAHRLIRDTQMRLPTPTERQALRTQIENGTLTRTAAVNGLTDTDTYRGIQVDRAFIDVLRRATDSAGRDYWIGRLDDGLVLRRLRANLYGSPEYYDEFGFGQNTAYVASAYRDILGRTAAPAEIDYWVGQIEDVGLPRGTIADRFLNTPEARQVIIADTFSRWAARPPNQAELDTWSPLLASSAFDGELALIRALAAGDDYFDRPDA